MVTTSTPYAARLSVDYPERLDRLTTAFRLIWVIPVAVVLSALTAQATSTVTVVTTTGQVLQLNRFSARVGAYLGLLTDRYPSTEDEQSVHLDIDYPDTDRDLNRWLPLVKWFLVIPHLIVLAVLGVGAVLAVVVAWFAILFTSRYPRAVFDYVVGVGRWALRVQAYATLLVTDEYPPFALK